MKIVYKIILNFFIIVILIGLVGGISIYQYKNTENIAEKGVYNSILYLNYVWAIMETMEHEEIAARRYLFEGDKKAKAFYFKEKSHLQTTYKEYYKAACGYAKPLLKEYNKYLHKYNSQIEKAFYLHERGARQEEIKKQLKGSHITEQKGHKILKAIIRHVHVDHIKSAQKEISSEINKTSKIIIGAIILSVFLSISLGIFLANSISKPIAKLKEATIEISGGKANTEIEIWRKDEIGDLARNFSRMIEILKETTVSRDYINNIIRSMRDPLVVISPKGEITTANKAVFDLLGYKEGELKGKNIKLLFPKDEKLFDRTKWQDFIKTDSHINYETCYITKDNRKIPALLSISVMRDAAGNIIDIICVGKDITERKKAELEIEKRKREVESINRKLIHNEKVLKNMMANIKKTHNELKNTQAQLIQSEKLASVGQLSAGIAHEINNPMAFINSNIEALEQYLEVYSEILRATEALKEAVEARDIEKAASIVKEINELEERNNFSFIINDIDNLLRESKSGAERIKRIVDDLRTFARKDEGQIELNNVEEILDGVLNIVWNEIKYKAELKKEYGGVPPIKCNAQKLGQVFINLLVNAAQAIDGKGEITIKTYKDGEFACVEVSDTGKGIAKEHLGKIFDPFFTTKEVGKGTGLGLSVSYDIVKQHKGEITVESEVNKGTKFTIKLPV